MEAKILLVILFSVWKVDSVQVDGPIWTRYYPCGSGVVHFEKWVENIWKAKFDLTHYSFFDDIEIVISFKKSYIFVSPLVYINGNFFYTQPDAYTVLIHTNVNSKFEIIGKSVDGDWPIVSNITVNSECICNDEIKALQSIAYEPLTETICMPLQYHEECGRKFPDRDEWITVRADNGGEPGDWPWHVTVYPGNGWFCGGTIISKTAVVTPFYCVKDNPLKTIYVLAGLSNLKSQSGRQKLYAKQIIRHPEYRGTSDTSNLAIIKVDKFEFSKYIQPICLLDPLHAETLLKEKETIFVGFGGSQSQKENDKLKAIDMTVIENKDCNTYYSEYNEFNFCTNSNSTISFYGDAGSGLAVFKKGRDQKITWFLRGVFTMCFKDDLLCDKSKYTLFADMTFYYVWLRKHADL